MSNRNFKDKTTGEEFYVPTHRMRITNEGVCYFDKEGKLLVNPKTGEKLIPIENKERTGIPMISKFNPHSSDGQRRIKDHFGARAIRDNTSGAGRDTKDTKLKAFKDQLVENVKEGKVKI